MFGKRRDLEKEPWQSDTMPGQYFQQIAWMVGVPHDKLEEWWAIMAPQPYDGRDFYYLMDTAIAAKNKVVLQ